VTTNGDIYIDNGESNGRIDRRSVNASISIPVMQVNSAYQGLFIDQNDTLYCSIRNHQVMKKYLNDNSSATAVAAGGNSFGDADDLL
jgi:hypothetical protein